MPKRITALGASIGLSLAAFIIWTLTLSFPVQAAPQIQHSYPHIPPDCTVIDKNIAADTVWDAACYLVVTNTVVLEEGSVLTITPPLTGTNIYFDTGAQLQVDGQLRALGVSESQRITFTSINTSPQRGDWRGILLAKTDQHIIQYSTVEYARLGVQIAGRSYLSIVHNLLRYNGGTGSYDGAIGDDTDGSTIAYNTIFSCSNGIILNESGRNQVFSNSITHNDHYGIAFKLYGASVNGGNDNAIYSNTITHNGADGIWMQLGSQNHLYDNLVAYNGSSGVRVSRQAGSEITHNAIYSNNTSGPIRAAVLITDGSMLLNVSDNTIYESRAAALEYDESAPLSILVANHNALCAINNHELHNDTGNTLNAFSNRWGTPHPNSPTQGIWPLLDNISGTANITPWITMAVHADSNGLITVTLRDISGNTVPSLPALPGNAPDARRVRLQSNWGTFSQPDIEVNASGTANAYLRPDSKSAPVPLVITATDFCGSYVTTTTSLADLVITKTNLLTMTPQVGTLTYTISYRNAGVVSAYDIILQDSLPANTTYVSDTSGLLCPACVPGATDPLTWSVGILPGLMSPVSFTLLLNVEDVAVCGALLTNTASITTTTLERTITNNVSIAGPITLVGPDVTISKTTTLVDVLPGETIPYTITYQNVGDFSAANVRIVDVLPPGTIYISDTSGLLCPNCMLGATGTLTWDVEALPTNMPLQTFVLNVAVAPATPASTTLTNTVSITTSTPECGAASNLAVSPPVHVISSVDIRVIKDDAVGPVVQPLAANHREYVFPGDLITYTITVINYGQQPATHVVLTETLPLNTVYEGIGWSYDGGRAYHQDIGTLAPNEAYVAYFVVRVVDTLTSSVTNITNRTCGWANEQDLNPDDNCNYEDTPVRQRPELIKTTAAEVAPTFQGLITFTITAHNSNPVAFEDVVLEDILPSALTWYSDTALASGWTSRTVNVQHITWYRPALAAHEQSSFELTTQMVSTTTDFCNLTLSNTVEMRVRNYYSGYPAARDTVTFTITCAADMLTIKDDNVGSNRFRWADLPPHTVGLIRQVQAAALVNTRQMMAPHREFVYEGDLVTYTITAVNLGPYTATNFILTEQLPLYSEYVGYGWNQVNSRTFTLDVGDIAPGSGYVAYFVVRVQDIVPEAVDFIDNFVCGWASTPDGDPTNNCNHEDTPIRHRFLRVSKITQTCIAPGDDFYYSIFITNTSLSQSFTQVVLTDTLPTYVSYIGGSEWQCNGRVCRDMVDNVPPASAGIHSPVLWSHLSATFPYTRQHTITNTVAISGGWTYILVTEVDSGPDLTILKNDFIGPLPRQWVAMEQAIYGAVQPSSRSPDQPLYVEPGDIISYTLLYLNNGLGPAHNVVLTEHLPDYTTYVGGGWTHVSGDTYTKSVGILLPGQGGEVNFYVQVVDPFPFHTDYVVNEAFISTTDSECNLSNNETNDDTPVRQNQLLYIGNRDSGSIDVFRPDTLEFVTSFSVGPQPFGLLRYEEVLYVANFFDPQSNLSPNTVTRIDLHNHHIIDNIRVGYGPIFMTAYAGHIYVANHDAGGEGITVIDHVSGSVVARIGPSGNQVHEWGFFGVTADTLRGQIYATKRYMGGEGLWWIRPDLVMESVVNTHLSAEEVAEPHRIVYNTQTDHIIVTYPYIDELRMYDAAPQTDNTLVELGRFATQQQATAPGTFDGGKGLDVMGMCAYNANYEAQSVSVLAEGPCVTYPAAASSLRSRSALITGTNTIILPNRLWLPIAMREWLKYPNITTHIPVGGHPKGLVAGNDMVYVTLPLQDRVAVIDVRQQRTVTYMSTVGHYPHVALIVYDAPYLEGK